MRFSCNKRSPFNPLRHCGSPVASLFDCSENLQAISITLLLAEVPGAGWGGVEEGRSARRRRQRESQRVNKGKMKTINLKCRAAAATRYRVDSPPFRGKKTCWFHIDLREARRCCRLAVFIQWEVKKKKGDAEMVRGN